eukprot:CAMPEP_0170548716 /NCGR_PEP_ID=MMETSP0211-20121228/6940_1 /TAXON_ID=311385 /ORGANISM="Pseudokeronopsis sp., Strain OXSARD2" /LENGTH=220 /DNA_ID=CAMNT_0010854339 /DNA_START=98 /DNA_END=757 /DNA_ORIENTATION=-
MSKRSTALGYGSRYNFSKGNISPSPNTYKLQSEFSKTPSSKAWSFGVARDAYSKVFIKEAPPPDKSIPGPGQYRIQGLLGSAEKYTLRPKTVNQEFNTTIRFNPGPGQYEPKPSLNSQGSYFVSKFRNSLAQTMAPSRSQRFISFKNSPQKLNPGPGQYSPKQGDIERTGSYYNSRFKSSQCRSHYHADRITLSPHRMVSPGPGAYRIPSDFGHYQSKYA